MASPKLLRILYAIRDRVQTITTAGGYYSDIGADVRIDSREPDIDDLPVAAVFMSERTKADQRGSAATCEQSVTVAAYRVLADGEASEEIGIQLLADIQRAVEGEDATLTSLLLQSFDGLNFQSDAIFQPESGETVVGARVTYAVPHIRKSGDPEIA